MSLTRNAWRRDGSWGWCEDGNAGEMKMIPDGDSDEGEGRVISARGCSQTPPTPEIVGDHQHHHHHYSRRTTSWSCAPPPSSSSFPLVPSLLFLVSLSSSLLFSYSRQVSCSRSPSHLGFSIRSRHTLVLHRPPGYVYRSKEVKEGNALGKEGIGLGIILTVTFHAQQQRPIPTVHSNVHFIYRPAGSIRLSRLEPTHDDRHNSRYGLAPVHLTLDIWITLDTLNVRNRYRRSPRRVSPSSALAPRRQPPQP